MMIKRVPVIRRWFATSAADVAKQQQFNVFDRSAKLKQRSKSPKLDLEKSRKVEYLRDEVAIRTIERLAFITRDFNKVLDFGAHLGNLLKNLCEDSPVPPGGDEADVKITEQLNKDKKTIRSKIKEYIMVDSSKEMLERDSNETFNEVFEGKIIRNVADEETFDHECLKESDQFDAVISNLSMHWINDLPNALANINRVLKPDGLFMGTLFGGDTLYELRTSLQLAELERKGGMSPRVSPLVHLNDVGSLLNRAGFSMLTIDAEDIVVGGFPDVVSVCEDLQMMGEQNAVLSRSNFLPRDVLLAANEIYKTLHGETDENGVISLPATFNVIFMIGWKKSDTQPQPLERGSAQVNLKDIL
ncbi:S-adenosyl-L-methionine-dependent methyltransferase [Hyphopichia burtonii NRRL Y-1933]|uniref:S-adenosyl-L-methionine-dependent methyltransferase n=1 Tax=Hyphopichia burtonii NRRL Y-1933 TaxID=984485 RepID=A0A1E4RPK3_9ASCO|nr:S-adenosyl-L-methionine-dependent methyltransferase [Hyphopichia burtonii NRRL Y-1933]ODV69197.1 S-adenosyl-L-methionine-dependent methyltransferase [Hyphopichia burtonii NRRL Y-1933]